jgi:hypothetical protein
MKKRACFPGVFGLSAVRQRCLTRIVTVRHLKILDPIKYEDSSYCRLSSMGCTKRGGDSIKMNKRVLTLTAVAAALVISTALIVSMNGDEKPMITTNPPAEDQVPQDSPVTPTQDVVTVPATDLNVPATDLNVPTDPEEPANDRPGNGSHEGNGGDDNEVPDAKLHGLARAACVHQRNMDKMQEKGKTAPQGLFDSTAKLTAMNLERMSAEVDKDLQKDNGKHTGQQQGHGSGDT